jgi:hypothetical protein
MGKSANHSSKEITPANLADAESKQNRSRASEEFLAGGLIPLDKEFIRKMLATFFQKVPNEKLGLQSSVFSNAEMNTAIVVCKDNNEAKESLGKINIEVCGYVNDYIEAEKGESCKKYYRNYSLYESKIEENRLILTWY